jgi:DNA (cytosine-5)-methyltransferase 1
MKKVRLIELFAGYGSQAMALDQLDIDYEHYRISEWNVAANTSYAAVHTEVIPDASANLSFEEVVNYLANLQITIDDKQALSKEALLKKKEPWCRKVYNEFAATHNLGSITRIQAEELGITNTETYTYMLTYSFPCVDLSMSGNLRGMKKGSGTRSGLLWEIERLFNELIASRKELPQILFMENVKQIISKRNKADFDDWCAYLESIGYTNSYQVLNAAEYGNIPQNRERCYMVSILNHPTPYTFPEPISLTKYLRDYLDTDIQPESRLYIHNEYAKSCAEKYKDTDFINQLERFNSIVSLGNYMKSKFDSSKIVSINGIVPTIKENHNTVTAVIDATGNVRKLSVKEFGRLMGVSEENITKILSVQSDSKARKQFGNSIVVPVMVRIFEKLFTFEYVG